jgi:carboxyl-terminal processing protease
VIAGLLGAGITHRLDRDPDIEFVRHVRDLAARTFVREVEERELVDNALRGMLSGLDQHARYYCSDEIARLDRETLGVFRGIGVVFRRPVSEAQILFPFPNSPAEREGLQVGDTLLEIDGERIDEMESGEMQSRIQLAGDRGLRFEVRDLEGNERAVEIVPEPIVDPTVRHTRILDEEAGIGYLSILSFTHRTPGEFDDAVRHLLTEGLRALVIDLRGNPGGILDAAVLVANRFVREGRIVATRTRTRTMVTEARPEKALWAGTPLALLVDQGSASASEVLAGALQDHCLAVLVGEATYGKGSVQTITPFDEYGARVKITTASYFTPSWRSIERHESVEGTSGIAPDLRVEIDRETRRAVYEYLASYSPPPAMEAAIGAWEEREGVDLLESPPEDRQLEAALALLRGDSPLSVEEPLSIEGEER